jgi:hypothetical protein
MTVVLVWAAWKRAVLAYLGVFCQKKAFPVEIEPQPIKQNVFLAKSCYNKSAVVF